jgi:hypothetical protein
MTCSVIHQNNHFTMPRSDLVNYNDALNHHSFGTFGTSAADQHLVPKASSGK